MGDWVALCMLGVGFGLTGWLLGRKIGAYEVALGYTPWFREYGSPKPPWFSPLTVACWILYLAVTLGTDLASVDPIVGSTALAACCLLSGAVSYVRHGPPDRR